MSDTSTGSGFRLIGRKENEMSIAYDDIEVWILAVFSLWNAVPSFGIQLHCVLALFYHRILARRHTFRSFSEHIVVESDKEEIHTDPFAFQARL